MVYFAALCMVSQKEAHSFVICWIEVGLRRCRYAATVCSLATFGSINVCMSNFHIPGCLMHRLLHIWTPGDGIVRGWGCHYLDLRILPGSLLSGRELKDGIGYEKSSYAEKAKPIVIAVAMSPCF